MNRSVTTWLTHCTLSLTVMIPTMVNASTRTVGTPDAARIAYSEERAPCADRDENRSAYFGDLHVHTSYSWDAFGNGARTTPTDAYAFARGRAIDFPPYDDSGVAKRQVTIDRPLDFVAVTDHAETLGEVRQCSDPGLPGFASDDCAKLRVPGRESPVPIAVASIFNPEPRRLEGICGEQGEHCAASSISRWAEIRAATEAAYDRTESCRFTALHGYEYTGTPNASNLHRNVIFRNANVPDTVVSVVEAPQPYMLWERLQRDCVEGLPGCDVLAIPHNSNLSNGRMFPALDLESKEANVQRAKLRYATEPLMEIFQHKAASECSSDSLDGILGAPDELCGFEQPRKLGLRYATPELGIDEGVVTDCSGGMGMNGMMNGGCVAASDFLRGALLLGLQEADRLGVNPYKLGVIASTDTHLANPGDVKEATWGGHLGYETSLDERLEDGLMPSNRKGNAGGLAGVWAVENSRDAIFNALERREAFGTSGPRIRPRLFAGWDYPDAACESADLTSIGYAGGVPMGGDLSAPESNDAAPRLIASALRDAGEGSAPLERLQVVKGWIDDAGAARLAVFDVAGETGGSGSASLCSVWVDPDFDAAESAYYYLRVLEIPTKRWDSLQCEAAGENVPAACESVGTNWIQERAWTSPIWYEPDPSHAN